MRHITTHKCVLMSVAVEGRAHAAGSISITLPFLCQCMMTSILMRRAAVLRLDLDRFFPQNHYDCGTATPADAPRRRPISTVQTSETGSMDREGKRKRLEEMKDHLIFQRSLPPLICMITDHHHPHYAGSSSFSQTLQNFPPQPLKTQATPFTSTTQSLTHTSGHLFWACRD